MKMEDKNLEQRSYVAGEQKPEQIEVKLTSYQMMERKKQAYMGMVIAAAFTPDADFKRRAVRDAVRILEEIKSGDCSWNGVYGAYKSGV